MKSIKVPIGKKETKKQKGVGERDYQKKSMKYVKQQGAQGGGRKHRYEGILGEKKLTGAARQRKKKKTKV